MRPKLRFSSLISKILLSAGSVLLLITIVLMIFFDREVKEEEGWISLTEAVQAALTTAKPEFEQVVEKKEKEDEGEIESDSLSNQQLLEEEPAQASAFVGGKLDLNLATAEDLQTLKGIGPSKARAVIEERERLGRFDHIEQLLHIKGIGKKTLDKLRNDLVLR